VLTIVRIHEMSLNVPGIVVDLQIATVLALRELLFAANFNEIVHFSDPGLCIYKSRANRFSLPTTQLVLSRFSATGSESALILFDQTRQHFHSARPVGHQRILNGTVEDYFPLPTI
jgi:hypothetical protein